jgi:hypothetical protein
MSRLIASRGRGLLVLVSVVAVVGSLTVGFVGVGSAQEESTQEDVVAQAQGDACDAANESDPRAECVQGNFPFSGNANNPEPDNCATRWPGSTQFVVDPPVDATSDDGAVTGDVSADGKLLNVTANGATVVLGVVVKGGNNFNAYTVVGNAIPPDMKSPLNNGGQLPTISHYTICYDPGRDGQISVEKKINDVGGTAKPDDAFVIGVDCNVDTYDQEIVLTVAAPGPEKSTAIPVGTDCVVAEKSLPAASTLVSYDPNGGTATTPPTVTVEEVGQTIAVVVTNVYAVQLAPTFTG